MDAKIIEAISNLPKESSLRLFIEDEAKFYQIYFNRFTSRIIREKKILEFENPNRLRVTYEFDVAKLEKNSEPMFLFLPETRKNWLKVIWEGRRLTVSASEEICGLVFSKVEEDVMKVKIETGYVGVPRKFWNEVIWPDKDHIPCFVDGSFQKENIEAGQMVVEYFDSFENYSRVGKRCSLFDERKYQYDYALESGFSHWLYVKAPDKFQVVMNTNL